MDEVAVCKLDLLRLAGAQTYFPAPYKPKGYSMLKSLVSARSIKSISECGDVIEIINPEPSAKLKTVQMSFESVVETAEVKDYWAMMEAKFLSRERPQLLKVWKIANCVVIPETMILMTADGAVIEETVRKPSHLQRDARLAHLIASDDNSQGEPFVCANDQRKAYVLASSQATNYYHFMIETLPRLAWLKVHEDESCVPVISRLTEPFQGDAFKVFGAESIGAEKLRIPVRFAEIVYVEQLGRTNIQHSPTIRDFYRSRTRQSASRNARIFISRSDSSVRRVENEEAITAVLTKKGFTRITLGNASVSEQIDLFAEAEIVVAPHGAGLTNIVFCAPGTKVVELVPSSFREKITSYAALSELFNLDYKMHVVESVNSNAGANANMHVNPSELAEVIASMLQA
jgi:capsular polysaccharide biosynthesis protein